MASPTASMTDPNAEVLVRRRESLLHLTLNRPRAINALNRDMVETVAAATHAAGTSNATAILLDGAGERGFCGGGDVKAMATEGVDAVAAFLRAEYTADYRVATSPVPVVSIMDGITMGGGIGLGGHAHVRVVTERSRLAMPETRIGIAPDVGGHLLLARAPGRLGELLAMTSGSMTAGDAIALGFADHFVPSANLQQLGEALTSGEDPEAVVARFAEPAPESDLLCARDWFDEIAENALERSHASATDDPVGAARRLIAALEESTRSEARETAASVRGVCPFSVAVTLAQIDRTRRDGLDLADVLADDLRIVSRLVARPDFAEGVRAQILEKDGSPSWNPAAIEQVDAAEVARVRAPLAEGELPLEL